MNNNKQSKFTSSWGFLLAAVGSAVGMANVWGFPAKMADNGGGAFLIAYLIFIALFSSIGLAAEYSIGRKFKTGPLGSYKGAWQTRNKKLGAVGTTIGWLPLIGSLCIALGYAVIVSYVFKAFWSSITGELMKADTSTWFASFSGSEYSVIPFHIIVVLITVLTMLIGTKGIEKSNKIMMPVFFVVFIILAIRVAFLPQVDEGYKFMFTCDWSKLADPMTWVWAMGQAFFSLSLTGSGMIVYGAYLSDKENVVNLGVRTAIFDTIAAMTAALVIVPACVTFNNGKIAGGPGLLFETLPRILQGIPFGTVFAVILYVALIFAGISSLQNMFEPIVESLQAKLPKLDRKVILCIIGALCLGVGIFMEPISKWGPWMDIVSIYIIPIGATLGAITWFWVMKKDELLDEVNKGSGKFHGKLWYYVGRYVYVPCAIILCLVALIKGIAF